MTQKRNEMIRRRFLKATGTTLGAGLMGTATGNTDSTPETVDDPIDVKVFVIAAFEVADLKKREGMGDAPGEFQLWYRNYDLTDAVDVPGAFSPVYHNDEGVAGTVVGIGKTNAATSLSSILRSPKFDFENTYFVTAGIAGSPPDVGTLGSVFVSDAVADWDLVHRWSRADGDADPYAMMFRPNRPDHVYELNGNLVKTARRLGERASLTDTERAKEYRKLYPQETAQSNPFVGVGTTMCGDTYWHGSTLSDQAGYIAEEYGASTYATTEMEDFATTRVLDRFGHLDRYVSLRSVSNFDQPHPCQSVQESLAADSGGFLPSVTNVYRVGSRLVDEITENWDRWETRRY